jgi:hypothetical protein
MKGVGIYLVVAIALAGTGWGALTASSLDRDLAQADRDFIARHYDTSGDTFDRAERYYALASRLPWIGSGPLNQMRAQRAAVEYWKGNYDAIVPKEAEPIAAIDADNVDLQIVVANAVYRMGQARSTDKAAMLEALDAGINAYASVLRNASGYADVAFNYEYLVRLRDEVDRGRRKPGDESGEENPHGRGGGPAPEQGNASDFKIYIPLESDELQEGSGSAGKAAPTERKG